MQGTSERRNLGLASVGVLSLFLPLDLHWVFGFANAAITRIIAVLVTIVFMDLMNELQATN